MSADRLTTPFRPDFLIIGAQKSGTSSLAVALRDHPDVYVPERKEAHHFGRVPDDDVCGPRYAAFFAGWNGQRLIGEATPEYVYLPDAARQITRFAPQVRAIAVLRNPVDRAYSAYWHGVRVGLLRGTFEEALADETRALARHQWGFAALVDRGRYVVQLDRWFRHGFPREQMLVFTYEALTARPAQTLATVQQFLGVDPVLTSIPKSNVATTSSLPAALRANFARSDKPRARRLFERSLRPFTPPPMRSLTREALLELFAPSNAALAELTGLDLSAWEH